MKKLTKSFAGFEEDAAKKITEYHSNLTINLGGSLK